MSVLRATALRQSCRVDGDLVEDLLDEDDADVDVLGYIGEELGDDVVDRVEGVADEDAFDGGRAVGLDAGDVEVTDLGGDGVGEEGGVVRHRVAVVALGDDGAGDGVEEAAGKCGGGHAVIVRIFVGYGGDEKGAEELADNVLREADAGEFAEAFEAGAVGGVGV